MYNVNSDIASEFINDNEILDTIAYAQKNKNNIKLIDDILKKAEKMEGISHRESAVLLECDDKDVLSRIYDLAHRIKERIKNCLLNSTKETRAEKLCAILNEVFEIYEIKSGVVNNNIDISFIKKIIDLRNSLFHGKKIDENLQDEIKCKSLELILLLQNILINWKT